MFLREYAKGLYHPFVYFVATNAAQLPFQIVYPVICAAISMFVKQRVFVFNINMQITGLLVFEEALSISSCML